MKITKANLELAIDFPSSIIKRKTTLPVCSCFRIEAKNNKLSLKTSDCDQFSEQKVDCDGDIESFCVSMNALKCLLPFFKDEVEMNLEDTVLNIKSGGKFAINILLAEEFPSYSKDGLKEMALPADVLADAVRKVSFTCEANATFNARSGVHVTLAPKLLLADATNGIRYARCEKAVICSEAEFFIPMDFVENVCTALLKCFSKDCKVKVSGNMIEVTYPSGSFACKLSEVKFPNTAAFMSATRTELGEINPVDWIPFLQGAVTFSGDDTNNVCRVTVKGNKFEHVGKAGQLNIDLPSKISDCELNLSAGTFLPILQAYAEQKAKLSTSDIGAIYLEADGFLVVTSQLRAS